MNNALSSYLNFNVMNSKDPLTNTTPKDTCLGLNQKRFSKKEDKI